MSVQKSGRRGKSFNSFSEECSSLYGNLDRENKINSYLKKSTRRDARHFQELKNITDSYMIETTFTGKESERNDVVTFRYGQNWQKKIEELVESKLKSMLGRFFEKTLVKMLKEHKESLEIYFKSHMEQIEAKLVKTEEGYIEMIKGYDAFLNVVDSVKEKSKRATKGVNSLQIEQTIKKMNEQINALKNKCSSIEQEQLKLTKFSFHSFEDENAKIKPLALNLDWRCELNREQLRAVVDTFNQNFIRIDQKLRQIVSYMA